MEEEGGEGDWGGRRKGKKDEGEGKTRRRGGDRKERERRGRTQSRKGERKIRRKYKKRRKRK